MANEGGTNGKLIGSGVVFFVLGFIMGIVPVSMKPPPQLPSLYPWWVGCFATLGLSLVFFGVSNRVTTIIAFVFLALFVLSFWAGVLNPILILIP